jgi:hypothetical protein
VCLEKVSVMKFGPVDKKPYYSDRCISIKNRIDYAIMMKINRKYRGMKDDIFEVIETA